MKKVVVHDKKWQEEEVDASSLTFRPSVYGVLIEDGKVLLSKQWDGYDFPGGGIDLHETVDDALHREFWEETGLKIKIGKIIKTKTAFYKNSRGEHWNCILIYYKVEKVSGELSIDNVDDHEAEYIGMPEWIDIEKTKDLKYYNSVESPEVIDMANKL